MHSYNYIVITANAAKLARRSVAFALPLYAYVQIPPCSSPLTALLTCLVPYVSSCTLQWANTVILIIPIIISQNSEYWFWSYGAEPSQWQESLTHCLSSDHLSELIFSPWIIAFGILLPQQYTQSFTSCRDQPWSPQLTIVPWDGCARCLWFKWGWFTPWEATQVCIEAGEGGKCSYQEWRKGTVILKSQALKWGTQPWLTVHF